MHILYQVYIFLSEYEYYYYTVLNQLIVGGFLCT